MSERIILVPVEQSIEANLYITDWYAANLRLPGDRLIFLSVLLVPSNRPGDADSGVDGGDFDGEGDVEADAEDLGGSGELPSAASSSPMEATMERQLAESVQREASLAAGLKAAGCSTFRYIHAFGRSHAGTLARIAGEQGAFHLMATYAALTADCDLAYAFRLFQRSRLALLLVPDPPY